MKKRTFVECLRYNIEHNWNEGSLFESMTKDDCVKACDRIEKLEVENQQLKDTIACVIEDLEAWHCLSDDCGKSNIERFIKDLKQTSKGGE